MKLFPIPYTSCGEMFHHDCKSTMTDELDFLSLIVCIVLVLVFFCLFELYECCPLRYSVALFVRHGLYYAGLRRSDHILQHNTQQN